MITWELCPQDREFFSRELAGFVPGKVYDMHAHLWRRSDWEGNPPDYARLAPAEITLEIYRQHLDWILPGREVHGLHFAFPAAFPNDPGPPNHWVSQEIKKDPLATGQFYVRPIDDPDWTREQVKRLGMRGFKPFANFAKRPDIENAEIPEYFPEWIARLAHEEDWTVTLHMQRRRSLADPSNLHWISTYCRKYPKMILILDHSGRGFNPYHCIEGLKKLTEEHLHNLYVDISVCCNPLATAACLRYLGPDRVLYGSDFFCSHIRGTNLPLSDSFVWLTQDTDIWPHVIYRDKPVLVGLENLRAVKAAFEMINLGDREIEAYFWGNAARILAL